MSEEPVDRSAREFAVAAMGFTRQHRVPTFTELEVGELMDDGLGKDKRPRAARLRKERRTAAKSANR